MVWKAEGRSRGVPRYRRGVAGRQGYRDKVEYVYTPTREQGDDEAVDINLRQTGDGEMCEARQDIQPCDSSTPESISSQRNDADSGKGTVHDNDLGFREEVEEVGVKRLLKYAACIEEHPLSLSETENNKQQQDDEYEESAKHKVFQESVHTCLICFSEYSGYSFTKLPCQHYFCTTCLKQYCNMHVKEGSVLNLNCPDTSCKEQIPPTYLKQLLDEEAFERWDNLSLQRALDAMADVVYCPKCKTASLEDPDHLVQCSQCRFSFCSLCLSNWHPGQTCMSPEAKLRILQSRRQGREMGEEAIKKEKELINECLDMDYIKREAKQCPTCRMAVQKSEGCNKMICTNCGGYFCFQCGKKIAGYDHFRGGSCILLDQLELNRWELQFNLQLQQLQEQDLVPRNPRGAAGMAAARPCPNCKQVNYKAGGNNHIFCWACQCHYCGLCNNVVRKGAGHFGTGPNKCKQHTPD
uniref:RBR-type E3 ubiquitin transferase n=1 Tax=Physcomitrium patens TaxID=3218 RepID=A0A7I4EBQ6_PHYPA